MLLYDTSSCSVTMLFACMLRLSRWEKPETLDFATHDCHLCHRIANAPKLCVQDTNAVSLFDSLDCVVRHAVSTALY